MQSCLKKAKAESNLKGAKIRRVIKGSHCGLVVKTFANAPVCTVKGEILVTRMLPNMKI